MKKLFIALFLLYSSMDSAQITLEHTYNNAFVNVTQISPTTWNYYTVTGSSISIYDISHSLIKTITIPSLGSGWEIADGGLIDNLSTNLFNSDSYYEYSVIYDDTIPPYGASIDARLCVYNELGTLLFSIDSTESYGYCFNTNSGIKMIVNQYGTRGYKFKAGNVYSLGGNYISAIKPLNQSDNSNEPPYPNPSASYIHLTYSLPAGVTEAKLVIINTLGQTVKTCNVGNAFEDLLFYTKQYPLGEYFYYIQTPNYISPTKKFIISK